jgi:uncharacterized protein YbjT (DUF2867 family)
MVHQTRCAGSKNSQNSIAMNNKPVILIIGSTGAQGGSVARALLKQKKFAVRLLVRNPNTHKARILQRAGAELVQGDLDDDISIFDAMKGCYGVFGVTNFFEHFAKEFQQGINIVEAAHAAGIKHLVMHSLPDYYKLSHGKFSVPHYDMKAAVETHARSLGMPATFVHMSFYYENFLSHFPLQKDARGDFYFGFPQGKTKLAMVSVEDLGGIVQSIFSKPAEYIGRTVTAVGSDMTCEEYASILSRVLDRHIYYQHIPRNQYAAYNSPGAEEMANMFEVQRLYITSREEEMAETKQLNPEVQEFEGWVRRKKFRFIDQMMAQMDVFVI